MFSGLTNQVTSWMGSAKGEQEEKVPTPTQETSSPSADINIADKQDLSPTKQKSKLDMLSNVKTQFEGIGGWIGSSIPKLRKGEENPAASTDEQVLDNQESTSADPLESAPPKDDDDNSSATGGADSGPQSAAGTPTEDKDGQFGNVQSKALAGAKRFGGFIYSAVNKAGKAVTETSAKIKETVEKNTILGEFNKEQEAFLKEQGAGASSNLPPWVNCTNEEALKEECLRLSSDKRNFVKSPPAGVDFKFEYDVSYPVAMAMMEQDPNLEKMRYELVPKLISEENFWRNYFYRVSLICQANELSYMTSEGDRLAESEVSDQPLVETAETKEFVSDTLQLNSQDLKEVEEGLKKLSIKSAQKEDEWEKELEAELQDYEVVSDQKSTSNSKNYNWEQDIEKLLQEETDLK